MKKRLLLIAAVLVLSFVGCKKDAPMSDTSKLTQTEETAENKETDETTDEETKDGNKVNTDEETAKEDYDSDGKFIGYLNRNKELLDADFTQREFGTELKKDAPAVDFDVYDMENNKVNINDILHDKKTTIFDFFQTTCKFCIEEMPALENINKRDDTSVVLLAVGESIDTVKKFMEEKEINLPVFVDESGELAQKYYISGFPTSAYVTKDGILLGGVVGLRSEEDINNILDGLKPSEK